MRHTIFHILELKRFKVFGHASSLAEARDHAETILKDSHRHDVSEALDYYHNTLLESIKLELLRDHKNVAAEVKLYKKKQQ